MQRASLAAVAVVVVVLASAYLQGSIATTATHAELGLAMQAPA